MLPIVLGTMLAAMDVVSESVLVWFSDKLSGAFRSPRVQQWRSRCTGAVLVALGLRLALVDRR
jgi:threonine/homoserine/homoserine lactone efflux protein